MQPDRPVLYAALICERVLLDEEGANTLYRLVDTINLNFPGPFASWLERGMDLSNVRLPLQFTLFTKWGGPSGEYTEKVTAIGLEDEESGQDQETRFTLMGGHHCQQIRHYMNLTVSPASGVRRFRIYLNDQPYIDVPFQINVESSEQSG